MIKERIKKFFYPKPLQFVMSEECFFDIKESDKFLFYHRIMLGKLLDHKDELKFFKGSFAVLYGYEVKASDYERCYPYYQKIVAGIQFWIKKEKELKYEPTPEERAANIEDISRKIKEFATIDAIAVRMHISHDDALKIPYATVFLMLQNDLEQSKFQKRYAKVLDKKQAQKTKNRKKR